jgi:hypothetical protein
LVLQKFRQQSQLSDVAAKMIIYRAFVEGKKKY